MRFFNKHYMKLVLICISFTIIFGSFSSISLQYILDYNMRLVCDVYYNQISEKLKNDIILLKSANEFLANNDIVINYMSQNFETKNEIKERNEVLRQINYIEKILDTISFVDSINLINLEENYLLSKGEKIENFDITKRPWYEEKILEETGEVSKLIGVHEDYNTKKQTISIITLIYDKYSETPNKVIGTAILDIYVDDMLEYINNSFYSGVLETNLTSINDDFKSLNFLKNKYNIYTNNELLENKHSLVFKFDKLSLVNAPITKTLLNRMNLFLWTIGFILSILLFISIRICFKSALMSISKLKSILEKLNKNTSLIDNKNNEFRQLEAIADILNKSFDEKIQELIYYDTLTKLPNRKLLKYTCQELISNKKSFALIFIDLNKFKYINDVFGHSVGDEYLIKFSSLLKEILGDKGILTRYSGDEFIIVYKDFIDNDELLNFYNKNILKKFLEPIKINSSLTTEIGFSAGVAVYPNDSNSYEDIIKKSDFMMYVNKKRFINRKINFFNKEIYYSLVYKETLKEELTNALKNDEFFIYYQPIVDKENNYLKAEALLRWNNSNLGYVSPTEFIKILEETREIVKVGYWIINTVCMNLEKLQKINPKIQISINISPVQLMLKDFSKYIKNILNKYKLQPDSLCFEITESVLLDERSYASDNIEKLKSLGIKIALDDFGSGYSSFNYLRSYNLDYLKIDKSFLKNNNKLDYDIINQIKEIAHLLNMKVILEGIENQNQFETTKNLNIDFFQGTYFSKPLAFNEFKNLIENK